MCNSLRKSERNTLLISGSNIAENSRMVELDGIRWFDSGLSIPFMKNHYILHKMPTTYDLSLIHISRTPIANFGEQVFSTADLNLKEVRMRMKYD